MHVTMEKLATSCADQSTRLDVPAPHAPAPPPAPTTTPASAPPATPATMPVVTTSCACSTDP